MKRFAVIFSIFLLFSCTRDRSPAPDAEAREYVFFRADNDAINIYELAMPGEEGPMWARFGEYRLVDVFR